MAQDFYEVLGVPRNADQSEIAALLPQAGSDSSPDVNKYPSAEARF